jgi:2'-5' RNA ligase
VGSFNRKDGAVWWVGVQHNPALTHLQRALTERLREAEIPFDAKRFQPHITLVRQFSPAHDPLVLPSVSPQSFTVGSLALMRSHRVNDELTYTPLALYLAEDNP